MAKPINSIATIGQTLAVLVQKMEHLEAHVTKIEARIESWNSEKSGLIRDITLHDKSIKDLEGSDKMQWRRIDWLNRAFWGVMITQAVMLVLLFGKSYIPLIK